MPYSYDITVLYTHCHIDMITYDMVFGEPVGGFGGSNLVTHYIASELSKLVEWSWGESPTF